MIRWILFFTFVCFSSASYAGCASGTMQFAPPIYVDLSDKLNATNTTWTATYTTQYRGNFYCSDNTSKFGYTKTLSSARATILGFNNNKFKVQAEITNTPADKILSKSGAHDAAELNTSFTVRFNLVSETGQAISGDTVQLSDVLFVSDISNLSIWDLPGWLINQIVNIVTWLTNGFRWPYDNKRDMFGQPMTITYAPKATTCAFNNPGLTVKLPTMGLQQVARGQNQPGLTPFTLNFSCSGISTSGNADRAIEMFLSSNNLLPGDNTVLIDNKSSATQGIGLRLIKRDASQSPVVISSSTTVRGSATMLFSVQAGGTLKDNFAIPMAAYYYAWNPLNATQGSLNTSAMLNIIYP